MEYSQFIQPEVLILVVVIYIIGMLLKGLNKVKDCYIPWILLIIAIILCIFLLGVNVNAFIQGVLITAAAVYGNQLIKQTQESIKK